MSLKPLRLPRLAGEVGRALAAVVDWAENVRTEAAARLVTIDKTVTTFGAVPGQTIRAAGGTVMLPEPSAANRGMMTAVTVDGDTVVRTVSGSVAGTTKTSVSGDALFISDGRDRHLAIHGARPGWRDLQGTIREGDATASLTWDTYRGGTWTAGHMRHDQDDSLSLHYQTQHDWDKVTPVMCHIHWEPMAADTNKVVSFSGSYTWVPVRGPRDHATAWTTFWATDTVTTGDVFTGKVTTLFSATPPANAHASWMLRVYLQRDGTGTTDTYTANKGGLGITAQANLLVDYVDVHYFADRIGTVGEYHDR